MNPIPSVDYGSMIYELNGKLNSKNEQVQKEAKHQIKNLSQSEKKQLKIACAAIYGNKNRLIKAGRVSSPKTKLTVLMKNIAKLKTDEIFKSIFHQFEREWNRNAPTYEKVQSFLEKNKKIISIASIKNPILWMSLSNQIRHNPKTSLLVKEKLLKCDDKLISLMNKHDFLKMPNFSDAQGLPSDLREFTMDQIPYKSIAELSNNISKIFLMKDFKKVDQFCHWMDRQKIPIQWLLFLEKGHQLPFPSEKWMPLVKCLYLGRHLKGSGDIEKKYKDLAEAAQSMKNVVEFNFDMAGGDIATEKFLTPFAKDHGNKLKTVRFFLTEWWSNDEAKPLEKGFGSKENVEASKRGNGAYVPFITSLTSAETISMKDFPMGPLVFDALPLSLKGLSISNCALNDEELLSLKRLKNLEKLELEFCPNVTASGIQALKFELPNLHIVYPR